MCRRAGFTPVLASYAYCLVFPVVAAVRLARRGAAGGSDVYRATAPAQHRAPRRAGRRAALLRVGPLPFGSSVVLVARKAAA